jgi:hypothetical protein
LNAPVRRRESAPPISNGRGVFELPQIVAFRRRRSRNKVSVGEPAEGSLTLSVFWPFKSFKQFVNFIVQFIFTIELVPFDNVNITINIQLLAMDILVPTTMKNAAKCDT